MSHAALLLGLAFTAIAMASLAAYSANGLPAIGGSSLLCLIVWLCSSAVLIARDRRGIWSPSVIFFNVFAVFHFGLGLVYWSGGDLRDIVWITDPAVPKAFMIVAWGGIALFFGMLLPDLTTSIVTHLRQRQGVGPPVVTTAALPSGEQTSLSDLTVLPRVGLLMTVASIVAWFALVLPLVGGRIWGLSYGEFLLATDDAGLSWVYFFLSLGVAMSVLSGARLATRWSIGVFALWALVALPIGLRGEVMFPTAAALMITSHRLKRVGILAALMVGILVLSLSAMFREVRREGWGGVDWSWQTVNPAAAVQELGQSLRPTFETIRWIEGGDQFLNGGSYWAPVERGFLRLFPVQARAEGEEDRRLMNVLVMERVGPIGFSPVAESYYNWGVPGVVLVMTFMGWIIAYLAVDPPSFMRQALMASIYVPLLNHIRNSFAPVLAQTLVGVVVIVALLLLEQWIRSRRDSALAGGSADEQQLASAIRKSDQNRPT
ncbi:MAG: O-antigen polysaccharide polymerase Wzy [Planctomycetes bacterium]|nr:O-antigen polysaccharide polymerase Wzy [Planctomycetota bacterium]